MQEVLHLVQHFALSEKERDLRALNTELKSKSRDVENNKAVVADLRQQVRTFSSRRKCNHVFTD